MANRLIIDCSFLLNTGTIVKEGEPNVSERILYDSKDIDAIIKKNNIGEIYLHGNKNFTSKIEKDITNITEFKQVKIISVE